MIGFSTCLSDSIRQGPLKSRTLRFTVVSMALRRDAISHLGMALGTPARCGSQPQAR